MDHRTNENCPVSEQKILFDRRWKLTLLSAHSEFLIYVTHLHETSHMSAEFVFRYGPKCMGGVILPILVLLHL